MVAMLNEAFGRRRGGSGVDRDSADGFNRLGIEFSWGDIDICRADDELGYVHPEIPP